MKNVTEANINSYEDINWPNKNTKQNYSFIRSKNNNTVKIPVTIINGHLDGPTFSIMSGMHAGEYSGMIAAQKIISNISPSNLHGKLIIIPVISVEAFYQRSMQISPIDQKEVHFIQPGNPLGTYSELLIDTIFQIVKKSDYLIDMHSGELVQSLHPWVPVPLLGSNDMKDKAKLLARGYRVDFVEYREDLASIPPLCISLADEGIVNIWVEIGKNGIPTSSDVSRHYDGIISALKSVGCLAGKAEKPKQKIIKGRRYQINAKHSGFWHPDIREGQIVEKGQILGKITDFFGNLIEEYKAPEKSLVLYYWTSPAIDIERKPHGYDWHSGLISLLELNEIK